MKILLTGGSGYVASYLENHLSCHGYTIHNGSRSTSPSLESILKSDEEYDYYIHTAGLSKDSPFAEMEPYMTANVILSRSIFNRFQKDLKAKRFIFISSLYTLDNSEDASSYVKTKAMVERELLDSEDSRIQIIRPALICAPTQARGILGPLHKLANKGVGIRFPKGFKMKWVSIETIAHEIENTLVSSKFSSILNLVDHVAELDDPNNWLKRFDTSSLRIVVPIPKIIVVIAFNLGHLLKLPFNRHFLRKLQS